MRIRTLPCVVFLSLICHGIPAAEWVSKVTRNSPTYHAMRREILSHQKPSANNKSSYDRILPGLYLGDRETARNIHRLSDVTHVLSIIDPIKKIKGVVWKGIELRDSPGQHVLEHFDAAFTFIDSAKGAVYVHCKAGISRSATFVIGYLMWKFDVSYKEAYRFVQAKRPQISPNPGFEAQLRYYETRKK